jgi:hypothetical protein
MWLIVSGSLQNKKEGPSTLFGLLRLFLVNNLFFSLSTQQSSVTFYLLRVGDLPSLISQDAEVLLSTLKENEQQGN